MRLINPIISIDKDSIKNPKIAGANMHELGHNKTKRRDKQMGGRASNGSTCVRCMGPMRIGGSLCPSPLKNAVSRTDQ